MRAFAEKLGIDNGSLSALLSQKRAMSLRQARRILSKLECSPEVERKFLLSVANLQCSRALRRRDPEVRKLSQQLLSPHSVTVLDEAIYQSISEWEHAAILELSFKKDFKAEPAYVAKALGIRVATAKDALARLFDLGLLVESSGRVIKRDSHLDGNARRVTSAALRLKQRQIREKAIEAIDTQAPERRYMTTITMCIDPSLLDEARRRIDEFNDSLCAFLESGERKEVYAMEIGLFSLEKREESSKQSNRRCHEKDDRLPSCVVH